MAMGVAMKELELIAAVNQMDGQELHEFFLREVEPRMNDWSIQCLHRLERLISARLDGHVNKHQLLPKHRHDLILHLRERRRIKIRKEHENYYVDQSQQQARVVHMINAGDYTLEQIAHECDVSVNFVVCTKREIKLGMHQTKDIRFNRGMKRTNRRKYGGGVTDSC